MDEQKRKSDHGSIAAVFVERPGAPFGGTRPGSGVLGGVVPRAPAWVWEDLPLERSSLVWDKSRPRGINQVAHTETCMGGGDGRVSLPLGKLVEPRRVGET